MSCCAPCSCGAIVELKEQGVDFCVLFFNPNIYPESEYKKRMDEQIRLCKELGVKYVVFGTEKYDKKHLQWRQYVRGLEREQECGRRCAKCFAYRFAFGVKWAQKNGYNAISSVFGVSKYKDQTQVDAAAKLGIGYRNLEIENSNLQPLISNLVYLPIKWDETLQQEMGKKADLYRQNYCGCEFSMKKALN